MNLLSSCNKIKSSNAFKEFVQAFRMLSIWNKITAFIPVFLQSQVIDFALTESNAAFHIKNTKTCTCKTLKCVFTKNLKYSKSNIKCNSYNSSSIICQSKGLRSRRS